MEPSVYREVREVLLETSHQFAKVRTVATRYANDLFANFPSLLCAEEVVTVLLEMLTVLRRACLAEFVDEVSLLNKPSQLRKLNLHAHRSTPRLSRSTLDAATSPSYFLTTTPFATRSSAISTATPEHGSRLGSTEHRSK